MSPPGNSPHLSHLNRREEVLSMLKNMYVSRRMAWTFLLMVALFLVLTACGGDSNTASATPAPTTTSTTVVGTTNTPTVPSPTTAPTQPKPTPTSAPARPTPTPTVSRPTPTPTPAPPKPTPTPTPAPTVVVTIITQS